MLNYQMVYCCFFKKNNQLVFINKRTRYIYNWYTIQWWYTIISVIYIPFTEIGFTIGLVPLVGLQDGLVHRGFAIQRIGDFTDEPIDTEPNSNKLGTEFDRILVLTKSWLQEQHLLIYGFQLFSPRTIVSGHFFSFFDHVDGITSVVAFQSYRADMVIVVEDVGFFSGLGKMGFFVICL